MKKKLSCSQLRLLWLIPGLLMLAAFGACGSSLEPTASALTPTPIATPTSTPVPIAVAVASLPTPIFVSTRPPEKAISLQDEELKRRLLNPPLCRPPCWEGVTPGETSAIEAAEILSANLLFTKVEVIKSPLPRNDMGFVNFEWNGRNLRRGDALFDYTTPDQIIYMIRPNLPDIGLDEFIEVYGEPSHARAFDYPAPDIGGPHIWSLDIIWFSQGIIVNIEQFSKPRIDESLTLDRITYFAPSWVVGSGELSSLSNKVKPWQGYGDFDLYAIPTPAPLP